MLAAILYMLIAAHPNGVRNVEATSCDVIRINVSLGMTTVLDLTQVGEPTVTLHTDEERFILRTHENAKRSIAILPQVSEQEVRMLSRNSNQVLSGRALANTLDRTFRTNLFVFFKSNARLIFQLRFVEKTRADYVVRIKQSYKKECRQ